MKRDGTERDDIDLLEKRNGTELDDFLVLKRVTEWRPLRCKAEAGPLLYTFWEPEMCTAGQSVLLTITGPGPSFIRGK